MRLRIAEWRRPSEGAIAFRLWTATLYPVEIAVGQSFGEPQGSLTPGKRADLIMIIFTDPTHMVVGATEPANIDTVVIDGRILKRNGKFTQLVPEQIISDAVATRERVRKRIRT